MYSPLVERLQSKPQSLQSLDGSKITQNEWQKEVALEQLFPKGNRIPRLRFHAQTHFHKRERGRGKGFSGKQRVGVGPPRRWPPFLAAPNTGKFARDENWDTVGGCAEGDPSRICSTV